MSAATAATSCGREKPSQARTSMVPRRSDGLTSQRSSLASAMTPVVKTSWRYVRYCAHVSNWKGRPAVGSCWKSIVRVLA